MPSRLKPEEALIYAMVTTSAIDRVMSSAELNRIGSIVKDLPPFRGFKHEQLVVTAQACSKELARPGGLKAVLDLIREGLAPHLAETAYILAAEVAAVDLKVKPEETRFLELLASALKLDKLVVVALERGARARHRTV